MASASSQADETVQFDTGFLEQIRKEMETEDEQREKMIKASREVLKQSKSAIYSLHRGELDKAQRLVTAAEKFTLETLFPIAEQHPALRSTGSLSSALEEWAEAAIFLSFLSQGRIPTLAELRVLNKEEYLGGLLDFTGELNRYAVLRATKRDIAAVRRCREVVDRIHGEFLLFDFRNGNLRRKYDSLKYTLKKLEQVEYEHQFFITPSSSSASGRGEEAPDEQEEQVASPKRQRQD